MAAYERQVRAAERQAQLQQWADLNGQMLALASVHQDKFPEALMQVAPPPEQVDEQEIVARHERERLAGTSISRRGQRRMAKEEARISAEQEIERERSHRKAEHDSLQASLDEEWRLLTANDRHAVFESIEAAFEDNEMSAAPIDVQEDTASLLMKVPSPTDLIPEREVTQTPTGRPTHKRRTKSVINVLYAEIMASHIVATAKKALAAAPGLARSGDPRRPSWRWPSTDSALRRRVQASGSKPHRLG